MRKDKKYLLAVALLAVIAVVFGIAGTTAPASEPISPQQESSDALTHFTNPPTYDSGWVDITDKPGKYVTLRHDLNTTEVFVDITGKQSLSSTEGAFEWRQTYGGASGDAAESIIQTSDGGYAMAGRTWSFGAGSVDLWLIKTDSAGNKEWNKTYGGTSADYGECVVQTNDGGYAIAGYTQSYGAGLRDFWLVKTDSEGDTVWSKVYGKTGNEYAYSVVQTEDGGYAIAGRTESIGAGLYDFWLVKTDASGNHQWNQTYGASSDDYCYAMIQTSDGGYALAGVRSNQIWLVRTDASGVMQWSKLYGGSGGEVAWSLAQTDDSGFALAGYTTSYGAGGQDFYLVKTDNAGNMIWNRTYGGTNEDWCYSIVRTSDNGYALAGYTGSFGSGGRDYWLVRTDTNGDMLWSQTYGGSADDIGLCIMETSDGGYAVSGYTSSFGVGSTDILLVKFHADTDIEHQEYIGGTLLLPGWSHYYGYSLEDEARSIIHTSDGGYLIAGFTNGGGASMANAYLVKVDALGNSQWVKTFTGADSDVYNCVIPTSDGGYAVVGGTKSKGAGDYDAWLVKTDQAGNTQWEKTYGDTDYDDAFSIVQTPDGGYAIGGRTASYGMAGVNYWLIKTDASGNKVWDNTYGSSYDDHAFSLVQTDDGGFALAGYTEAGGADSNVWLVKTNSAGTQQWTKTYGGAENDWASCLIRTSDGGFALAGQTVSYGTDGTADFWLIKTDALGNTQWDKTYGGEGHEVANSIVQTSDGGYALAGDTASYGAGNGDFWLVKTDALGNKQFSKTYGGANEDRANCVIQAQDGGYTLAGYTYSYGWGDKDVWLVKTDAEFGLARTGLTEKTVILYRGKTDLYWNFVRVRIWLVKEPTWVFGDIDMDGYVGYSDFIILAGNYGKTFSMLSLGGIAAIAGIRVYKKRKQDS